MVVFEENLWRLVAALRCLFLCGLCGPCALWLDALMVDARGVRRDGARRCMEVGSC